MGRVDRAVDWEADEGLSPADAAFMRSAVADIVERFDGFKAPGAGATIRELAHRFRVNNAVLFDACLDGWRKRDVEELGDAIAELRTLLAAAAPAPVARPRRPPAPAWLRSAFRRRRR